MGDFIPAPILDDMVLFLDRIALWVIPDGICVDWVDPVCFGGQMLCICGFLHARSSHAHAHASYLWNSGVLQAQQACPELARETKEATHRRERRQEGRRHAWALAAERLIVF